MKGLATQEDTRHRRKGELKPDVGRGEGIIQKQQQKSAAQGGKLVPLPIEQRTDMQQQDHHRCPHHGRGTPGGEGEKQGHRNGNQRSQPPPFSQQHGKKSGQKGQVHAGHRHGVAQACALEGCSEGVTETVPVARHQGLHQPGYIAGKGLGDALLQRLGPVGGSIPQRDVVRLFHLQTAVGLSGQEDAFGGVVGDLLPGRSPVSQNAMDHRLDAVTGPQVGALFIHIEEDGHGDPPFCIRPG